MSPHGIVEQRLSWLAIAGLALVLSGCAKTGKKYPPEVWPSQIHLSRIDPITVLPGTTLHIVGEGFVGDSLGHSRLVLKGTFNSDQGKAWDLNVSWPASLVSEEELSVSLAGDGFSRLCPGAPGDFVGTAVVEVASVATGKVHKTEVVPMGFHCRTSLTPAIDSITMTKASVNAKIPVTADNLLLGDDEGTTMVSLQGCFLPRGKGAPCETNGRMIPQRRIPLTVAQPELRRDGSFILPPDLLGLSPGTFTATVQLVDAHGPSQTESTSNTMSWTLSLEPSQLLSIDEQGSSLGGFVKLSGQGFVGQAAEASTTIHLSGQFTSDLDNQSTSVDLILVAGFESGETARYILDEKDSLGKTIDMRKESGLIQGTFTPTFTLGSESVTGDAIQGSFRIQRVKQVVYVNFMQGYIDALETFGLRAADPLIRKRIIEKAKWTYRGLNVEFRQEPPKDYLLYAQVDVTGADPNNLGLMGYDNTPGKDVGNMRLYDCVGGVNAKTQQDGFLGYGGVFVESFFAFSLHPPIALEQHPAADGLFDAIFDPVRPDRGHPARPEEVANLPQAGSATCPANSGDRPMQIACAVFVLGNILGATMAHELGHSLGLADPGGERFHNAGEQPNRLMDAGGKRPFKERAELLGGGPEVFCKENYEYLRTILPVADPVDPVPSRPTCN